jgi:hypothetical protein
MRVASVGGLLLSLCLAADSQPLKTLRDAHEWFKLRDAVEAAQAPALYRAAAAYAFHDLREAEKQLRLVIRAAPKSGEALEARGLLIYVAQMRSDYQRAIEEIRRIQALTPSSHGLDNGAALFGAMGAFPRQKVSRRRFATVRHRIHDGNLFLPVSVNGKAGDYIFDTGANFSLVSEEEARRLGLTIRNSPGAYTTDSAGTHVAFRIAQAERLAVGDCEIRNVVFMVVSDAQQPFVDLPVGSRAVLGLPLALAFETIRWNNEGRFEIGFDAPRFPRRDANLCFDRTDPVAKIEYQSRPMRMFLDTGAALTRLMPLFAADFPDTMKGAKTGVATVRGVGGSVQLGAATLPEFAVRMGSREVSLRSAQVLLKNPDGGAARFHVWGGLDLFEHVRSVTIDFRSMRFIVE